MQEVKGNSFRLADVQQLNICLTRAILFFHVPLYSSLFVDFYRRDIYLTFKYLVLKGLHGKFRICSCVNCILELVNSM